MRLPIILLVLTVLLLPADLQGFAHDIQSGTQTVVAGAAKLFRHHDEGMQVAEAAAKPVAGTQVTKVQ